MSTYHDSLEYGDRTILSSISAIAAGGRDFIESPLNRMATREAAQYLYDNAERWYPEWTIRNRTEEPLLKEWKALVEAEA